MQPYSILETLFRHNLWANLSLLEVCAALSEEQWQASIIGGFGSISDTWQHLVLAERSYFARISTGQRFAWPDDAPALTVDQMKEWLRMTGEGLVAWAPKVSPDETVEVQWDSANFNGPVRVPKAVLLTQAINHATEHRAQIMAILTQLGVQPPDLDGWSYFEAQGLP